MSYGAATFEVGDIVSTTLSVWTSNFFKFFAASIICLVPIYLLQQALFSGLGLDGVAGWDGLLAAAESGALSGALVPRLALMMLIGISSYVLVGGAVTCLVVNILDHRPTHVGAAILMAVRRVGPLIVISILSAIIVGIGFVLLIVPGIILALMLSITVPCCMVERRDAISSMGRSADLTKGYRLSILGAMIVFFVGVVVLGFVLNFAYTPLLASFGLSLPMVLVLNLAMEGITGPIFPIAASVIYVRLVGVKEGRLSADLADAFD